MNDIDYMHLAIQLARKGAGCTSPNPMVGAVIVKDHRVIGTGFHQQYGQPHAERNALSSCVESPEGAVMYVNLEPCCHYGKQPPCVDAIWDAGIERVVIGCADPNPLVCGKGIQSLREHGIAVTENILKEECLRLNEVFFHYVQTGRPFVILKYAMTLDGKTAAYTGASKWITGETARHHVHQQRHRYSAVMSGIGTVLADDPLLTCRTESGKNPIRIICDSSLRTPLSARIIQTAKEAPVILATCCNDHRRHLAYQAAGCTVCTVPEKEGHVDLQILMQILGQRKVDSLILEGGGTLNWAALESGIVQKVQAYIAPRLLGGQSSKTPVEGPGLPDPSKSFILKNSVVTQLGTDFLIESEVDCHVYRNC